MTGRNVSVGLLAFLILVFVASYFGARLAAIMSNANLVDDLRRAISSRRKLSPEATGDEKLST
jgi:hypothetical protein